MTGGILQGCGGSDEAAVATDRRQRLAHTMASPGSRIYQAPSGEVVYGGMQPAALAPDWMRAGIDIYGLNSTHYVLGWPAALSSGSVEYEYSIDGGTTWASAGASLSVSITGRAPATSDLVKVRARGPAQTVSETLSRTVALPPTGSPQVIVRTIGVGGDYPTPQAWQNGAAAELGTNNLVAANVVWEGWCLNQEFVGTYAFPVCDIHGHVTNASCYMHLTAAPGASFKDHVNRRTNPLRYNASVGAALTVNQGNLLTPVIDLREGYARVSRLQIRSTGNGRTGWGGWGVHSSSPFAPVFLDDCIVESGTWQFVLSLNYGAHRTRNCLIVAVRPPAAQTIQAMGPIGEQNNGSKNYNTLFISVGARSPVATVARTNDCLFQNCGFFGVDAVQDLTISGSQQPGPTYINCYTDAPGNLPAGCLRVPFDESDGAGFESLQLGAYDLRLRASSALRGAGVPDSVNAPRDIVGSARLAACDVGPWQFY